MELLYVRGHLGVSPRQGWQGLSAVSALRARPCPAAPAARFSCPVGALAGAALPSPLWPVPPARGCRPAPGTGKLPVPGSEAGACAEVWPCSVCRPAGPSAPAGLRRPGVRGGPALPGAAGSTPPVLSQALKNVLMHLNRHRQSFGCSLSHLFVVEIILCR